jgi:hypothetical protein
MLDAIYTETMFCAECGVIIESGQTCYLLELPGEVIVCSRECGNAIMNSWKG